MKMNFFICGFQRRVWCPKWTPASRRSFILMSDTRPSFSGSNLRGGCDSSSARRVAPAAEVGTREGGSCVGHQYERSPRGRRPLRTPDSTLESANEEVHLHGAERDLHHRSAEDAEVRTGGPRGDREGHPR